MRHRGYDDQVSIFTSGWNLGMVRLAINDLNPGHYPMIFDRYELIFNGEIYNYPSLKSLLHSYGIEFSTSCDAEVILPLFAIFGPQSFEMLDGMFAIAIVDTHTQDLYLARDKAGEKPLYYAMQPHFSFASEMKALFALGVTKTLNKTSLSGYLHNGASYGKNTLITEIQRVEAAHYLHFSAKTKQARSFRYWRPKSVSFSSDTKSLIPIFESLLLNSVKERLLADVPIGTFLSGGVDSSLITAITAGFLPNLHTFSVSFPEYPDTDESLYAQHVSNILGTQHTEVLCTSESVKDLIAQAGYLADEPIVDPAILPTFLMTQAAREKVTVVLTGEGADEVFGGYQRYQKYLRAHWLQSHLPTSLFDPFKDFLPGKMQRGLTPLSESYSPQNVWTEYELLGLLRHAFVAPAAMQAVQRNTVSHSALRALKETDMRGYLSEQLLMKVDKIAMQNNLEARAPYLDSRIVAAGLALSDKDTYKWGQNKLLLRKIASQYLPDSIVWREKHGFEVPLDTWFRNQYSHVAKDAVRYLSTSHAHLFRSRYLTHILQEHLADTHNHSNKLWSLTVLAQWLETHDIDTTN